MNIQLALEQLNLDQQATAEAIEKTYRKLITRYPPEFNPEKFRQIDEAYRFLSSFPRRVEMLFAPESGHKSIDLEIFNFENKDRSSLVADGIREVKRMERMNFLWEGK